MSNINIKKLEYGLLSNSLTKPVEKRHESPKTENNFKDVLKSVQSQNEIKFSKHASERLNRRNIKLSNEEHIRLGNAFIKAEEKGVKDALIIMDDKAFIANIKSKTIVTTMNNSGSEEGVYTNIDGAVII